MKKIILNLVFSLFVLTTQNLASATAEQLSGTNFPLLIDADDIEAVAVRLLDKVDVTEVSNAVIQTKFSWDEDKIKQNIVTVLEEKQTNLSMTTDEVMKKLLLPFQGVDELKNIVKKRFELVLNPQPKKIQTSNIKKPKSLVAPEYQQGVIDLTDEQIQEWGENSGIKQMIENFEVPFMADQQVCVYSDICAKTAECNVDYSYLGKFYTQSQISVDPDLEGDALSERNISSFARQMEWSVDTLKKHLQNKKNWIENDKKRNNEQKQCDSGCITPSRSISEVKPTTASSQDCHWWSKELIDRLQVKNNVLPPQPSEPKLFAAIMYHHMKRDHIGIGNVFARSLA